MSEHQKHFSSSSSSSFLPLLGVESLEFFFAAFFFSIIISSFILLESQLLRLQAIHIYINMDILHRVASGLVGGCFVCLFW